uniref:Uncharacterized protein n=1 Tax=Lutzomyia longipalpis TaxID=7200 RepID=A0A1B0CK37_LUTLO
MASGCGDAALLDALNSLDGITIRYKGEEIKVYFVLGQILGDNLGLNSLLGYNTSFNSNYYCRFCTRCREDTRLDYQEYSTELRNMQNYHESINLNDPKCTGVQVDSIFNTIPSYHVTNNKVVDMMHDIYEGVCHYDLAKVLNCFIYEKKLFTLETLNARKQLFDYGEIEIRNRSPPIRKPKDHNLNHYITAIRSCGPVRSTWCFSSQVYSFGENPTFIHLTQSFTPYLLTGLPSEYLSCWEASLSCYNLPRKTLL